MTSNGAQTFFDLHVIPNLKGWLDQPTDIRLAMNAVVSLYHTADHFWYTYQAIDSARVFGLGQAGQFRAELAKRNPHFEILRDVAEAHKHMELTRPTRIVVAKADQTAVGATGYGEGGYGTGPYGGGPSIVVHLNDGTKQHLSYVAEKVRELWVTMLA